LDVIQETVINHDQRLTSLEENAESLHQRLEKVENSHEKLHAQNEKLRARLTELEGRGRRSNVRLVGIPEGTEGPQPSLFFSQLLRDVFGHDTLPTAPELDRAHRSLVPKPGPRGRPRPVIILLSSLPK